MISSSSLSSSLSLYPKPNLSQEEEQQRFDLMAVEARHMNLFPQQIITNRDLVNSNQGNGYGYNTQMGSGAIFDTTMAENFLPFNQSMICDSVQGKTSMKADSGLTYNLPAAPRKRSRDSMNSQLNGVIATQKSNNLHDFSSVIGEESFSLQIQQQQQLEMDLIIAQHTKKIRLEIEERQKQQARLLVSAIGEGVIKKLKEKDEQIQKMGKLNLALQERVKCLYVENQLWRDLAQTNEATALSLRCNLEQVLAHVSNERVQAGVAEEAESCCGSNDCVRDVEDGEEVVAQQRMLAGAEEVGGGGNNRLCRICGERESCVLLLPCRHLCLCTYCGTTLQSTCPACNSTTNATVHVNLS